jgi:hypothetical protein
MSAKTVGVVVALVVLAGGGYYLFAMNGAASVPGLSNIMSSDEGESAPIPAQSGSVDDFSAAIDAELKATNSAIGAMDADTDASVSAIQTTGDSSQLYDPNSL